MPSTTSPSPATRSPADTPAVDTAAGRTLRALARLLSYPDAEARRQLATMAAALDAEKALDDTRRTELRALLDWIANTPPLQVEAAYVELFDGGRATSLHLFEHVHGDSRARGPAMIDLAQSYATAGFHLAPGELPDCLPAVLEFASTRPPAQARAFLGETAHILNALFAALQKRRSPYAAALGALVELAGEKTRAVEIKPEPPLEASWPEPPVFGACASAGHLPHTPAQAVHFVPFVRQSSPEGVQP